MIRELKLVELDDLLIRVSSDGYVWTTHKHKIRKNGRVDNRIRIKNILINGLSS